MNIGSVMVVVVFAVAMALLSKILTPFLMYPKSEKTPKFIIYIVKLLPAAVIFILIATITGDDRVLTIEYWLPEIISVTAVVIIHTLKNNSALSLCGGMMVYVILIKFVF